MTKQFESQQLGHFRYSLPKITPHEKRKEGKPRGKPPLQKKEEKNAEWPKVTYLVVSTTPSIALSSENFFSVKDLVKMYATCCSMGQYCSEMTFSWINSHI
jgi:hypothetical protein